MNFTLPGSAHHISHQYFNILIERDLVSIPYAVLYLVKMHVDVYLTPRGSCSRSVIDGIALRPPALLCSILTRYCVTTCAMPWVLLIHLLGKLRLCLGWWVVSPPEARPAVHLLQYPCRAGKEKSLFHP